MEKDKQGGVAAGNPHRGGAVLIRISGDERERWGGAAKAAGYSKLTSWCRAVVEAACGVAVDAALSREWRGFGVVKDEVHKAGRILLERSPSVKPKQRRGGARGAHAHAYGEVRDEAFQQRGQRK